MVHDYVPSSYQKSITSRVKIIKSKVDKSGSKSKTHSKVYTPGKYKSTTSRVNSPKSPTNYMAHIEAKYGTLKVLKKAKNEPIKKKTKVSKEK